MTRDRAELRRWYRKAMRGRIEELRTLLTGLESGDAAAVESARRVAQALRGSGGTFGFPGLSEVANVVETSADGDILRRVSGLIEVLRDIAGEEGEVSPGMPGWLPRASGLSDERAAASTRFETSEPWVAIAHASGLDAEQLTERVAAYFGLEVADFATQSRAATRLVPEALVTSARIVPLTEASATITVATADPTALETEVALERLTGRRARFVVAAPARIEAVLGELSAPLHGRAEAMPAGSATPSTPSTPDSSAGDFEGMGVLVVDDEATARLLVRSLLEKRSFRVVEAEDGLEALEAMREHQPIGLVVADLNMPRMDGLELIWELRDHHAWGHLPVIVVTGERDEVLETQLIEEGADDYIRKPVDPRLFVARVEATIRRSAGRHEGVTPA